MSKYTYQIKTGEFEFINGETEGTSEDAVQALHALKQAFGAGSGLDPREFNKVYDTYRITGSMENGSEVFAECNKEQQEDLQKLKRSFARNK